MRDRCAGASWQVETVRVGEESEDDLTRRTALLEERR